MKINIKCFKLKNMNTPENFPTFPFVDKVGCILDVLLYFQPSKQQVMKTNISTKTVYASLEYFALCCSCFCKNPFSNLKKKKKGSHSPKHLMYKNWSDKFKTQLVIYNSTTHRTCVQSHITHVEPLYCKTHNTNYIY